MSFSWEKILAPDEVIKREFSISTKFANIVLVLTTFASLIVSYSVLPAGFLLFLLGLLYWYYLTHSKHYAFTSKRILIVDAFLSLSTQSIDYVNITDIQAEQSFIEKMIGIGSFTINTASTHAQQTKLPWVDNPQEIKKQLDEIRDKK